MNSKVTEFEPEMSASPVANQIAAFMGDDRGHFHMARENVKVSYHYKSCLDYSWRVYMTSQPGSRSTMNKGGTALGYVGMRSMLENHGDRRAPSRITCLEPVGSSSKSTKRVVHRNRLGLFGQAWR